ncbi:MAG: hypothetical protein MRZ79_03305 [Bacteroidia bacterium]|nr:hypothetical protein [Bacteroidia bacterium]
MKNLSLLFLWMGLLPILLPAQHSLRGIITYQDSNKKAVAGAEVSALWSKKDITNSDGEFSLLYANKGPGYETLLKVVKQGYEVVNKDDLLHTLTKSTKAVKLYVCPEGEWQRKALAYYEISENHFNQKYKLEQSRIRTTYAKDLAKMNESLRQLDEKYKAVLGQIQAFSERMAKANLDDVSDLYQKAFEYFKNGEFELAISALNEKVLEDQFQRIQRETQQGKELVAIGKAKLVAGEEALEQSIENYLLRADLQVINFQFDDADLSFNKAIAANPERWNSYHRYGIFLQERSKFSKSTQILTKALSVAKEPLDLAMTQANVGLALFRENRFKESLEILEKPLITSAKLYKEYPENYGAFYSEVLNAKGLAHLGLNNVDSAGVILHQAINLLSDLLEVIKEEDVKSRVVIAVELANTAINLGNAYAKVMNYENAIKFCGIARDIYRPIVQVRFREAAPYYADILSNLGTMKVASGRRVEGITTVDSAIQIVRKLAEEDPEIFNPKLAVYLNTLGLLSYGAKRDLYSQKCLEESKDILQLYYTHEKDAYAIQMFSILLNLGNLYTLQGKYVLAKMNLLSAERIRLEQSKEGINSYGPDLIRIQIGRCNLFVEEFANSNSSERLKVDSVFKYVRKAEQLISKCNSTVEIDSLTDNIKWYGATARVYQADYDGSRQKLTTAFQYSKTSREREEILDQLIPMFEDELLYKQRLINVKDLKIALAESYGLYCLAQLSNKHFKKAEISAVRARELDPGQEWVEVGYALAKLLQGEYETARRILLVEKDKVYQKTYTRGVYANGVLNLLKQNNAIPSERGKDVQKIRKILK